MNAASGSANLLNSRMLTGLCLGAKDSQLRKNPQCENVCVDQRCSGLLEKSRKEAFDNIISLSFWKNGNRTQLRVQPGQEEHRHRLSKHCSSCCNPSEIWKRMRRQRLLPSRDSCSGAGEGHQEILKQRNHCETWGLSINKCCEKDSRENVNH